jgi:hypothetical protein
MRSLAMLILLAPQEIPKPAPLIPPGAWASALKEHPRLLGPRAHLKALAQARPLVYAAVKPVDSLLAASVVHAVDGLPRERIEPHLRTARGHLQRGVTNVHQDTWIWLSEVAMIYDFFFYAIPAAERTAMVDWMNGHLGKYTDDENAFHNSTLSKILCYLQIAYATWGENPRAREFRDHALVKLYEGKVAPALLEFGAGGGFVECGWYSRGSLWHLVQALELARRFEKYDGFQKAPRFFYQRLAYELHESYPGSWIYGAERYPVEGDGAATYGGHSEYPRHLRTALAQYFRGSELARHVSHCHRPPSNPEARVVDFITEEEPDPPLTPASLPLAHLASGIGRVYARSDWTPDATWFRFECGDFWNNHQHLEVGNFEIFRREPLATESGEYHDYASLHAVNWLLRTVAHNCILVYQPDEKWAMMRDGGRNPYANDGGQAKKWSWVTDTLEPWKARRAEFDRGDITAYENRPEYLFVAADGTKAYAPSKMALWIRQIVFLRPHTFVIFDRVQSTRPEYEKTWLLHCRYSPEIQGANVAIANGKGRLFVESLLPEKARVDKVEGYTYRGQSFNPPRNSQTELACRWRVEVSPPAPRTDDVFLHVLSTEAPPNATLVRNGARTGVKVGPAEVTFEGRAGGVIVLPTGRYELREKIVTGRFE